MRRLAAILGVMIAGGTSNHCQRIQPPQPGDTWPREFQKPMSPAQIDSAMTTYYYELRRKS